MGKECEELTLNMVARVNLSEKVTFKFRPERYSSAVLGHLHSGKDNVCAKILWKVCERSQLGGVT